MRQSTSSGDARDDDGARSRVRVSVLTGFDRCGEERDAPDLISRLASDASTKVLVVRGDRLRLVADGSALSLEPASVLARTPVGDVVGEGDDDGPGATHHESTASTLDAIAFLGRAGSTAVLLAVSASGAAVAGPSDARPGSPAGEEGVPLRSFTSRIAADDAAVAAEAVALARWHGEAQFCPACGALTEVRAAGWSRHCPACGREHFPRTDPAVIVAVTDPAGQRLLLGANAAWPSGRFSCFAGFVEAGESAESALRRELLEEAGVEVSDIRYRESQAWPYPRSLMLGYLATATDADAARPDRDEIVDVRWFSRDEVAAGLRDELPGVTLPGAASVSRRLIEMWLHESAEADFAPAAPDA